MPEKHRKYIAECFPGGLNLPNGPVSTERVNPSAVSQPATEKPVLLDGVSRPPSLTSTVPRKLALPGPDSHGLHLLAATTTCELSPRPRTGSLRRRKPWHPLGIWASGNLEVQGPERERKHPNGHINTYCGGSAKPRCGWCKRQNRLALRTALAGWAGSQLGLVPERWAKGEGLSLG